MIKKLTKHGNSLALVRSRARSYQTCCWVEKPPACSTLSTKTKKLEHRNPWGPDGGSPPWDLAMITNGRCGFYTAVQAACGSMADDPGPFVNTGLVIRIATPRTDATGAARLHAAI
jgi:hypothetical protein